MNKDIDKFRAKVLLYEKNTKLSFREKFITISKEALNLSETYKKKIEVLDNTPDKLKKGKIIGIKVLILMHSVNRLCIKNNRPDLSEKVMKPLTEFIEEKL